MNWKGSLVMIKLFGRNIIRFVILVLVQILVLNNIQISGYIVPKHCWQSGVVYVAPNGTHGIGSNTPIPFHSLLDSVFDIHINLE